MSLLFLAADFPPSRGGIQTVAYELPLALHRAGQEVGVVALCQEGAGDLDASCPYPVVRVPGGSKWQIATNLAAGTRELARQLQREPCCLVATKWFPEGFAAMLALKPRPVPMALMAHGREFRLHGGNPVKWLLQKYVLRHTALAFAVSHWTAKQLAQAGVRPNRIQIVNNGIRPEAFQCPGDVGALRQRLNLGSEPVLLTTGRLVARKGHAQVIRLLPRIMERIGPVTYVIVGTGPQEQVLRDMAQAQGVAEQVRFAGAVGDQELATYYHLCDVFVMPVRLLKGDPGEGFGIVYLEANAAGKPVVATNCAGVPDAVEDGVSGLLVPPDDDAALLAAITRLLADPALAHRLGARGQQRLWQRFTWDHAAARFLAGLEALR